MDEREKKLRRRLTPAGKAFAGRLDRALAEEIARLNSAGGDAIREEIERHHLRTMDSVQSVNRLAEAGRKSRPTSYYMIMNYATMLLATDGRHRSRGVLSATGEQLLEIWRIYGNKLVDCGEASREQIDAEETQLMRSVRKTERERGGGIFGRIKALFK